MSPNWLMLIGGGTWLAGELWGVYRNKYKNGSMDTTSEFIWWAEMKWPILRSLVAAFTTSLVGHLGAGHTPLVP